MRSKQRVGISIVAAFLVLAQNGYGRGANNSAPAGNSAFGYTTPNPVYTEGTQIAPNNPIGGCGYAFSGALPPGLILNSKTGQITGIPTAVAAKTPYTITASNKCNRGPVYNTGGGLTTILNITVADPVPLSDTNINLIFVVSPDADYPPHDPTQPTYAPEVSPATFNLTSLGLQRSLQMATYLQRNVLGMKNITGIYALAPMTQMQHSPNSDASYPDMASLEYIQQFAVLNQISLYTSRKFGITYTGQNYPINASYANGVVPSGVPPQLAYPPLPAYCPSGSCQGLDFNDYNGDNEALIDGIVKKTNANGFYVFSAPWETIRALLGEIGQKDGYHLSPPTVYQGPNVIYAISIPTPSGNPVLVTYDANLTPSADYPVLPPVPRIDSCPKQNPSHLQITGGVGGAVIPTHIVTQPVDGLSTINTVNTNETVYIVRHAEAHPQATWSDNNYVGAGQWRALDLPNVLPGKIKTPDSVWSLDPAQFSQGSYNSSADDYWSSVAPALTVQPYAIANNLPYNLVSQYQISAPDEDKRTFQFFFSHPIIAPDHGAHYDFSGQTILLGWMFKQNTKLIKALVKSYFPNGLPADMKLPEWRPSDYDSIWTVTIDAQGNLTADFSQCEGIDSKELPVQPPYFPLSNR